MMLIACIEEPDVAKKILPINGRRWAVQGPTHAVTDWMPPAGVWMSRATQVGMTNGQVLAAALHSSEHWPDTTSPD